MFLHASLPYFVNFLEQVSLNSRQILRICCPAFRLPSLSYSSFTACARKVYNAASAANAAESEARCSLGRARTYALAQSVLSDFSTEEGRHGIADALF